MRTLVSNHIFIETAEGRFANNHVSEALVGDAAFRAIIVMKYVHSMSRVGKYFQRILCIRC